MTKIDWGKDRRRRQRAEAEFVARAKDRIGKRKSHNVPASLTAVFKEAENAARITGATNDLGKILSLKHRAYDLGCLTEKQERMLYAIRNKLSPLARGIETR